MQIALIQKVCIFLLKILFGYYYKNVIRHANYERSENCQLRNDDNITLCTYPVIAFLQFFSIRVLSSWLQVRNNDFHFLIHLFRNAC